MDIEPREKLKAAILDYLRSLNAPPNIDDLYSAISGMGYSTRVINSAMWSLIKAHCIDFSREFAVELLV